MKKFWVKWHSGALRLELLRGAEHRIYLSSNTMVEPRALKSKQSKSTEISCDDLLRGFVIYGDEVISCECRELIIKHIFSESTTEYDFRSFYNAGSWRRTRKEAEKLLAYRKAVHDILAWKHENCLVNGIDGDVVVNYRILYSPCDTRDPFHVVYDKKYLAGSPIGQFWSRASAETCIRIFPKNLKTVYTYGA